jgi:hypothetical protein
MRHPKERLILPKHYCRRDFLRLTGGLAGGALLSACGGAAGGQGSPRRPTEPASRGTAEGR